MATTVDEVKVSHMVPELVVEWTCSALDETTGAGGETLSIPTNAQITKTPYKVEMEQTADTTSGDPLYFIHISASDSTANETIQVKFKTDPAGDLAGATCTVRAYWNEHASGGTSIS